jgi:hypothetical protein
MSETIRVDEDILNEQITRLQGLARDGGLRGFMYYNGEHANYGTGLILGPFPVSTGDNVTKLQDLLGELYVTVTTFYTLAERTLTLLTEGKDSFIKTDKGIAECISTGADNC